jgi:transposase InsO family protein
MAAHHDASLVTGALEAAVATRGRQPMADTIFHSDRASEPTSTAASMPASGWDCAAR